MARLILFAPVRRAVCAAAVAVALAGTADVVGASARSDYERFLARVEAMRLDGPRPTPRPQMRRAIADGAAIARRHAGSGYADNALWQAATLALASFRVYRQPSDRTHGLELLDTLVKRYPSSSLIPEARALLRKHAPSANARAASRPEPATKPRTAPVEADRAATTVVERTAAPTMTLVSTPPSMSPAAAPSSGAPAYAAPAAAASGTGRMATLRGVRRTRIGDTIRLTLDFDGEVAFDQQRLPGPDRVFFDFARTAPIAALTDTVLHFEGSTVRRVRLGRPKADVTRLAIDLDGVARYSVFTLYHPFRLTIDLEPASAVGKTPLSADAAAAAPAAPTPTATRMPTPTPPAAPLSPPVPRTNHVPNAAAVAAPSVSAPTPPPPALLRANRIAAPSAVRPAAPPTRIVVAEPLLAAGDPLQASGAALAIGTAPALTTRVVARPPALLRTRRTHPLMVRAAIRPPRGLPPGLELAAFVAPAGRSARASSRPAAAVDSRTERDLASAPVAPLPPIPLVPTGPSENGAGGFSIARQLGLGVSRIVIDPGHGGKDPGASGSKTTEAEVVLDIALRVERLLALEAGIEVVLTRRDDTFIPLEERTAMANRQKADLFLSIHANSSRNRKAAGVETYVLNFATSADAAAVAARENASAAGSMRNLPDMVRAITQGNKRDESRELASAVQESMVSRLRPHNAGLRDLGVKQAPFVVLIGAGMPSVLAEIAFISHEGEGSLLRTEKYRQRIADALAAAVLRYTRTLKPVGTVASQD